VQIDWSFESGSLCMAEIAGPDMVRVLPRRDYDHEGRNWTSLWCYFRLKGAAGKTICLQFLDLTDEWNHRASFSWGKHTRPGHRLLPSYSTTSTPLASSLPDEAMKGMT
jgi:hypothetical protein